MSSVQKKKNPIKVCINRIISEHSVVAMVFIATLFLLLGIGTVSLRSSRIVNLRMEDIGELVTQVGYFTDVQVIENDRDIWGIKIPFTQSKYIFSYDGIVKAGIDFAEINVNVDELTRRITIELPEARIISNEIATDSLEVYDESRSAFSPLKLDDINQSLNSLKSEVEEKAVQNGILDNAVTNAKMIVSNFIASIYDLSQYTVEYK